MSVGLVVNPRMSGFAAISFMPARSAPSAKSFTRKRPTKSFFCTFFLHFQNVSHRRAERFHHGVRSRRSLVRIPALYLDRITASGASCFHVTPAIAHHVAALERNAQLPRRGSQHPRSGLAAPAPRALGMGTDLDQIRA